MRTRLGRALIVTVGLMAAAISAGGQSRSYRAPRTADGKPDLNGIWQALNEAHWDLEAHAAAPSPVLELGAAHAVAGGLSLIDGGTIPYTPAALKKKQENYAKRLTLDPEIKCYLPGVPRANYMPYPFQIVQSPRGILFVYEYATANRMVNMGKPQEAGSDTWMGTNYGHWEGDTLVVDKTNFTDTSWIYAEGRVSFHSDAMHLVERYRRVDANTLEIEATVEDPKVLTKPWVVPKQTLVLAPFDQIMELACSNETQSLIEAAQSPAKK